MTTVLKRSFDEDSERLMRSLSEERKSWWTFLFQCNVLSEGEMFDVM